MRNIRNFAIIAHIDHGKSTLADRFLEITGTVGKEKMRPQFLDAMDLERERGITIKMQPVRMVWQTKIPNPNDQIPNKFGGSEFLHFDFWILNLIDTPGHVDFSYEVSRSLAAIEGAILLVDATKGVQAQTIANLELAKKENIVIIPAVNKIDLPQAKIEETILEISELLKISPDEVVPISAKTGENVPNLLQEVIKRVPPPKGDPKSPLKALIFDSKYDPYFGVVAYVRIFDGTIKANDNLYLIQAQKQAKAREVGWFLPEPSAQKEIKAGEVGYVALGIKDPEIVRIGDTITVLEKGKIVVKPLPGYKIPNPVVFVSIYPENPNEWELLKDALLKLKLNDSSLYFEPESKSFFGKGFRCGFLGLLHAEIVTERIKREFGINLLISSPSVSYKIITADNKERIIYSPKDWPDPAKIKEIQERYVMLKIITPPNYLNSILKLLKGKKPTIQNLGEERVIVQTELPLREILSGFYDRLKSVSQGFASMDYTILDWRKADLVKLEILIAKRPQEALAKIVPRNDAYEEGKKILEKLYKTLPPQMFDLALQAKVGGKIIARKTIRARRKDVTAPLYGGDVTRKKKLLEKQKKGKKKLEEKGQMSIPPQVFWEMFREE